MTQVDKLDPALGQVHKVDRVYKNKLLFSSQRKFLLNGKCGAINLEMLTSLWLVKNKA